MSSLKAGIVTSGFGDGSLLLTQGYGSSFLSLTISLLETLVFSKDLPSKWIALEKYLEDIRTSETFATKLDARRAYEETIYLTSTASRLWNNTISLLEDLVFTGSAKSLLKVLEKKIEEIVSRLIPSQRFLFKVSIPVFGNLFSRISRRIEVRGSTFKRLSLPFKLEGNPISKFSMTLVVLGSSSIPINHRMIMLGTSIHKFELLTKCKGIKDFKKILWEILDEEE